MLHRFGTNVDENKQNKLTYCCTHKIEIDYQPLTEKQENLNIETLLLIEIFNI